MTTPGVPRHSLVAGCAVLTLIATVWPAAVSAQDTISQYDGLLSPGWERIGSFKGAAGPSLLGRVNDLLFEQEASGSLYRDLGDVSLGLSYRPEAGEIKWDNSFYRRVLPLHREIERGGVVTGADVSSYLDIKTLISRGRARYDAITNIIGNDGAIGVQVEGGVSLSLGRIHPSLVLGDRPLEEALDDADRGVVKLTQDWPQGQDRSLLRLATEGIAGLTQAIANAIGRKTIDTERAAIFYESYGDTITLFLDVGLPVEAEPFTEADNRLGPGDFVRQITFVGLSPISAGIRTYGVEVMYQRFYRFIRETTIVKETGGTVLVQVRTAMAKGNETTPLKIRPEVRLLGVLTLGYTFFEQVYTDGDRTSYETVYRIDLNDPRGMACFRAILGDGGNTRMRPLAEAAVDRDGAEQLAAEIRQGDNRFTLRTFRCFSLFDLRTWRVASADLVDTADELLVEDVLANTWSKKKRLGRNADLSRQLLIRTLTDLSEGSDARAETGTGDLAEVTLITGVRNGFASGDEVRRAARVLRRTLEWDDHPVLDELAEVDPDLETRFALNLRLSLGHEHVDRIAHATEDELWTQLADLLLGQSRRDAWATPEERTEWKRSIRRSRRNNEELAASDALDFQLKPMTLKARYRLARRSVKKFGELQRLVREGDCLPCLTRSFKDWESATVMQVLSARIGSAADGGEIGYHYEVFTDEMLRPITVANEVQYQLPVRRNIDDTMREAIVGQRIKSLEGETSAQEITSERAGWQGDRFMEPSLARLNGGEVLLNIGAEAAVGEPAQPCWMLRLYSDLQFSDELSLRIDLREHRGIKADDPLGHAHFAMGTPSEVLQTPFMTSRYSYDIPLPAVEQLQAGTTYNLVLRVLNADGRAVSEEQQVQLEWPLGGLDSAAPGCYVPPVAEGG